MEMLGSGGIGRFAVSSSPTDFGYVDVTIPREDALRILGHAISPGDQVAVRGPLGEFYFAPSSQSEPLFLIAAGVGVAPMLSILRFLADTANKTPCTLLCGARTQADLLYHREWLALARQMPQLDYLVALTQPDPHREGPVGRIDVELVRSLVVDLPDRRCFLSGLGALTSSLVSDLSEAGVPLQHIHLDRRPAGAAPTSTGMLSS